MGYCVDVKCLTTRFSENVPKVQKSPRRTKTSAKAKKSTRNTEARKNEQKLVQGKITSTDIPVSLLADEAEHNAEHKFTGPKREPTITTNAPPKTRKIEKTTETEKTMDSPFSFFSDGFASLFSGSNVQSEIETRYSSQCSLSDKINQNSCCSPYDASPCCEYNQRIRRVFGIARFGLSRINLPQKRIVGGTPAGSLKCRVVILLNNIE